MKRRDNLPSSAIEIVVVVVVVVVAAAVVVVPASGNVEDVNCVVVDVLPAPPHPNMNTSTTPAIIFFILF